MKATVVLVALVVMTGCSLFKVSVSTGEQLPAEEMQIRVMTRGFYYDMSSEVSRMADSIVFLSPDAQIKIAAIRWKLEATRAAVDAAMQSIPEVSLADTWILCKRMENEFTKTPDSLLFGQYTYLAQNAAEYLQKRVRRLAREVLTPQRYSLMESFVDDYIRQNPIGGAGLTSANTTLAWLDYLKSNGIRHAYQSGSISEVIADLGDRVGGQTQQFSNSLSWSKDIIELQLQQDSTRMRLEAELDSLENNFNRMVLVMEHIPEISDFALRTLAEQMQKVIYSVNASVDLAFRNIDLQRAELQEFISAERANVMVDVSKATDSAVQTLVEGLPAVMGKIVFWIILLVVVVLGIPFAVGYWVGSLRERGNSVKTKSK